MGNGPLTGGGRGYCNPAAGRGVGYGAGRGLGRGRGRGFVGLRFGFGYGAGVSGVGAASPATEREALVAEAANLKQMLANIERRLQELEA